MVTGGFLLKTAEVCPTKCSLDTQTSVVKLGSYARYFAPICNFRPVENLSITPQLVLEP